VTDRLAIVVALSIGLLAAVLTGAGIWLINGEPKTRTQQLEERLDAQNSVRECFKFGRDKVCARYFLREDKR
jgi:hypothetical protein